MKKMFTMCALALVAMLTAQAVNVAGGTRLFLNTGGVWGSGGDRFAIYFSDGMGDAWADMTATATSGLYEATVPEGSWSLLIYCRLDGATTGTSWDNVWNQTEDLTYDGTNNLYTITSWGSGMGAKCTGEWSFHNAAAPVVSLTAPAFVFLGEADITLEVVSENVTAPAYAYYVKTPEAADFVPMEAVQVYTPQAAGEYTFRVTVAESTAPATVLAEVEKTVMVREVPEPITIKVKVPAEWGTTISLWCWDEYDTGHWLYTTADGEWYTATLERLYPASFIVVNGSDWTSGDNSQQTVDVMGITASGCYEVGAVDEAQQGKRVVTSVDCGEEPGTGTGLDVMESHTTVLADGQGIQAAFDGTQRVQLYSVSGQLLHDATCNAAFAYPAAKGIYLLRIGGEAYKVAVK